MELIKKKIADLVYAEYNPRIDLVPGMKEYEKLKKSIETFGYVEPIIYNKRNSIIIGGHQRLSVMKDLGYDEVDAVEVDLDEAHEKALNVALNKISGDWDNIKLHDLLENMQSFNDLDIELTGFDVDEIEIIHKEAVRELKKDKIQEGKDRVEHFSLKDIYGQNPFSVLNLSVLNTRDGDWDKNNKFWKELIQDKANARSKASCMNNRMDKIDYIDLESNAVSILDPTLCEIICRWFLPNKANNKIFDTFAGDTSMSFVACSLNNYYTGIELRQEQVDFNVAALKNHSLSSCAKYICDDGRNVDKHIDKESQDLYFSCPPYYDMEVYSDLDNDASNQDTYEDFYKILDEAFRKSIKCLKNNRFAVVVAGDVRDHKTGGYYDFIGDIKRTFMSEGLLLYNDLILVNKIGAKIIMTHGAMKNRKVHKVHQNVLIFYKGDVSKIKEEFFNIKDEAIDKIKEQYDVVEDVQNESAD